MPRISLIYLLCSLTGTIFSQDTGSFLVPNLFSIKGQWTVGDTFKYAGIKEYKSYETKDIIADSSSQEFALSLVVADSTDSTYVIRVIQNLDWQKMTMLLTKSDLIEHELNELLQGQECQHLEYVIDQNGAFLEMKNLDAFVKSVTKAVHKLIDHRIKSKKEKKAAKQFQSKILTPVAIQNRFIEELMVLHRFFGHQYILDSLRIFDDEIPNVFSPGKTVTRHNRLIASIPPEGWDGLVSIQDSVIIDGEAARALLRGYSGATFEVDLEDNRGDYPVSYKDLIDLVIYPKDGLVYAFKYERFTYFGSELHHKYTYFIQFQEE